MKTPTENPSSVDGQPMPDVPPEAAGSVWDGRYEVERRLGQGGMSHVYLAHCRVTDRKVVLKVLKPPRPGRAERLKRSFRREVFALQSLRHDNIVQILDCNIAKMGKLDVPYYTMEYLDGAPLHRVHGRQPVAPRWALRVVRDLARGLHHAHEQGFIHRDLKPHNVLIVEASRPVLLDFGLVKLLDTENPLAHSTHAVKGTWDYMAPEQFTHSSPIDHRSDIYSLGGVLLWLLTGLPPNPLAAKAGGVPTDLVAAIHAAPPKHDILPHLDAELESIWQTALASDPLDRFESMEALADAIDAYLAAHDAAPVHTLQVVAGAEPARVELTKPGAVVGSCPESIIPLPRTFPATICRLLRPTEDYLVLPDKSVPVCSGPFALGKRPLRHGDAIDIGPLRLVYRRDPR